MSAPHSARPLRPLPPRPNLEFERKEAKALLRHLRAGDPEALARARLVHPGVDDPGSVQLADAQLVIAREYGFASWPKLVRWFSDVERLGVNPRSQNRMRSYESMVRALIAEHRDKRVWTANSLAAYVPRFYGMRTDDVFALEVGEDDARLAVARQYGFPSWDVLREYANSIPAQPPGSGDDAFRAARDAVDALDVDRLRALVEAHPELLDPPRYWAKRGRNLVAMALNRERQLGTAPLRPLIEWLESQGLSVQRELNMQLCGRRLMETETVRWLLERGADPNWVAPNGIPVLEHALIRYWNGDAVDLLATHASQRQALWISAGLGDVNDVRRFLGRDGKPTPAGRKLRPDFDAVGQQGITANPDPDDHDILLEAFLVAMLNARTEVLEYMTSRGFDVNTLALGSPLINMAVGNGMLPVVETLLRCGASVDIRGWRPNQTARQIAQEMLASAPEDLARLRIAELCRAPTS